MPLRVERFAHQVAERLGRAPKHASTGALASGPEIEVADPALDGAPLPVNASAPEPLPNGPFRDAKRITVESFERAYLVRAPRENGGNVSRTAEAIGMMDMTAHSQRQRGFVARLRDLWSARLAVWIREREAGRPDAVYERAIGERVRQYAELKRAVAGILYMRNKIEGEIRERKAELARLHRDIARAQKELDEVSAECETAKGNLVRFRAEIQNLEREGIERTKAESRLDADMDAGLERRVRAIRDEAKLGAACRELDELKRRLRPAPSLYAPFPVREVVTVRAEPQSAS